MPEQQHPAASDPSEHRPEETTPQEPATPPDPPPGPEESGDSTDEPDEPDEPGTLEEPVDPGPEGEATRERQVAGRRVTTRTVDRREVTEHTRETITEDLPLEAYQGPASAHPAPVG